MEKILQHLSNETIQIFPAYAVRVILLMLLAAYEFECYANRLREMLS